MSPSIWRSLFLGLVLVSPHMAVSQDTALLLGQERYEQQDRVRGADDILRAEQRLQALGFDVTARANGRVEAVSDLARAFQADLAGADRLVVALSGHFVTDGVRTWLLTAEADDPDLFTVGGMGLSLDSLLVLLAERPGQAVLVLGQGDPDDLDLDGSSLTAGIGSFDIPQGVTVIATSPAQAAAVLSGILTEPEARIGARLSQNSQLDVRGFLPADWVLMPGEVIIDDSTPVTGPTESDLNAEARLWDQTTAADTVEAYRIYVSRYPRGRFVEDAEAQIEAILAEPNRAARLIEEALGLDRRDRRGIQANLTLLNYNTRGVDGIFGPGSRGAITNWQQSNGFPQTSYLTRDQINLLDAQAARRQAEIEAQEAQARAEAEALDRSYWAETGARGDEPGFRAYLERYPNGLFSDIARARVADIDARRAAAAEAADRAAWSIADADDTVVAYQEYLAAYPNGVFAGEARDRLDELTAPRLSNGQVARARAEEQRLRLSGVRAQLLELRLRDLGFNPGRLDGVVDDNTRRAIAAYQEANGLPPTGFVDQATAVGLMTGSISITVPGR